MKKVPNLIKKKLDSYVKHYQKAENIRIEIENWFKENGIDTDIDSGDIDGGMITDIIIDTGVDGNVDNAVIEMEKVLNDE